MGAALLSALWTSTHALSSSSILSSPSDVSAASAASLFNFTAASNLAAAVSTSASVAAAVNALQLGDDSGGAVSTYFSSLVSASPRLAALFLYASGTETVPRAATVESVMAALRDRAAIISARPSPPPLLPPAAFDPVGQIACPPPPAPRCVYGTCYNGTSCVCWLGASGPGCGTLLTRPPACSGGSHAELGLNLAGLADWSTEQPYVDFARVSRAWNPQSAGLVPQSWTWGEVPMLDEAGYASELTGGVQLGTMMVRDLRGHYSPETYYAMWEGDGCVSLSMDDVKAARRLAPGLIEFDVVPTTGLNNGIYLVVSCTKAAGNHVRGIRVVPRSALHTYAAFP